MRASFWLWGMALASCAPVINPPDGVFVCTTTDDCPPGFECGTGGRCFRIDGGAPDAGPPGPTAPRLLRPWNGDMTGSVQTASELPERNALRPEFVWEEVPEATRYELGLTSTCLMASFASCDITDVTTIPAPASRFRPPNNLTVSTAVPVGRRYFFRLRACFADETCTPWTSIRYVDVGRTRNDYDGDGVSEFVIGSRGFDIPGRVVVFDAVTATVTQLHSPREAVNDGFGYPLVPIGDVNADGFSDLAIGATGDTVGGETRAGAVHVFLGSVSGLGTAISIASPAPIVDGGFGASVAGVDLDGDGYSDVAIGDRQIDAGAVVDAGGVHIFNGSASGPRTMPSRQLVSSMPVSGSYFPADLANAGDVDGDGNADLAVGDPYFSTASVAMTGAIFIFDASSLTSPSIVTMATPAIDANMGWVLAGRGDLNGDGYADFVASAYDQVDGMRPGSVFVFYGSAAGLVPGAEPVLRSPNPVGDNPGFGNTLAIDGDLNGDGLSDLSVGEFQGTPAGGNARGAAYVFFGRVADPHMTPDYEYVPPIALADVAWMGRQVAYGFVDGDGFADIVVTASNADDGATMRAGLGFLYNGSETGPVYLRSISSDVPTVNGEFGETLALLWRPLRMCRVRAG